MDIWTIFAILNGGFAVVRFIKSKSCASSDFGGLFSFERGFVENAGGLLAHLLVLMGLFGLSSEFVLPYVLLFSLLMLWMWAERESRIPSIGYGGVLLGGSLVVLLIPAFALFVPDIQGVF